MICCLLSVCGYPFYRFCKCWRCRHLSGMCRVLRCWWNERPVEVGSDLMPFVVMFIIPADVPVFSNHEFRRLTAASVRQQLIAAGWDNEVNPVLASLLTSKEKLIVEAAMLSKVGNTRTLLY
ncbi:hypothetical protein AKJ16_DCAP10104 [Drosera capensis]